MVIVKVKDTLDTRHLGSRSGCARFEVIIDFAKAPEETDEEEFTHLPSGVTALNDVAMQGPHFNTRVSTSLALRRLRITYSDT
ncbi:hypothetical protein AXG93_2912s1430 [Marchantia polymorpha subsp. ruderalis]|uniref:Uncharacterized protein n=1 Tax=Marchantia polymorpha subsp. ruderalis TaxID=1480154 RepID=A0A176WHR1_MARPO|nr:hypothetical protein AXG93_2912s1430 [Marchantia polymorpha subsp. ruderalis]